MAQTAAIFVQDGDRIDYTPGSAVSTGDVIVNGQIPNVATADIAASTLGAVAAEGVFDFPKITGVISAWDPIYWNATGDPVSGTAGSGAANKTGIGNFIGYAVADAASGDYRVKVLKAIASPPSPVQSVAAAGSTNADAGAITITAPTNIVVATGGDATKGVILPAAPAGTIYIVKNGAAAVLKIYPPSGAAINALTATTGALSMASNTCAVFAFSSATQVYTAPLLPS